MALTKTFPTQDAAGLPITDTRRVMSGLVARNADGTPRPGVFPGSDTPIVTGRASMGYNVAAFLAALARFNNGVELIANDASMTVNTTAAPASNSRIDVIWVRSRFQQHADGSNLPEIGVTQGTAAAVPSKPVIPAGALELATAEILSTTTTTATAVITQTHPFTAAAGGTVLVRSKTELDLWAAANGSIARTLDTDLEWVRRAGVWFLTPGQRLAYMAGSTTSGVAGTILGSIAKTAPLPVGQRVKVRCTRVGMYNAPAGGVSFDLALRNNVADVTSAPAGQDKRVPGRAYQPGSSQVVSVPGVETEFVTTTAAPVSAALFVTAGISFGGDGQELWIESA